MMKLVEVQVQQGLLRGQRLKPPKNDAPEFDAFLGVPYAKPPVGELRFKAPQPPEPWEGARPALDHGADSPHLDEMLTNKVIGKDDCLYLNVYSPQVPSSVRHPVEGAPWPVMVWFFPGGFTVGSSSVAQYAPEYLVAKGVVVVTVTYRLGAFGFLSLNSKLLPGNAGLKDGVAALRWVRDNISVFGGNPDNVTVFGCSAGGAYAEYLQLAPAARGLFHRAISQSASVLNQWTHVLPASKARARAFRLGEVLGCTTQEEGELLAFLQKVPAKDIVDKYYECIDNMEEGHKGLLFPFLPVSEAGAEGSTEEVFLADNPRALLTSHRFFPVPWMVGLTDYEGILTAFDNVAGAGICYLKQLEAVDADLERVIPAELELAKGSPESVAVAKGIRQLYFNGGKATRNTFWNLFTDLLFGTGIVQSARLHASHPAAAPVFVYLFGVVGKANRLSNFFKLEDPPGACHGDELGYLFSQRLTPEADWEEHSVEATTRRRLTALWTNFARTGNPTPPSDPAVEGVDWKPLDNETQISPFLDIGASLSIPRAALWEDRVTFWDEVFRKHYNK